VVISGIFHFAVLSAILPGCRFSRQLVRCCIRNSQVRHKISLREHGTRRSESRNQERCYVTRSGALAGFMDSRVCPILMLQRDDPESEPSFLYAEPVVLSEINGEPARLINNNSSIVTSSPSSHYPTNSIWCRCPQYYRGRRPRHTKKSEEV
jgi:hypothetical protein